MGERSKTALTVTLETAMAAADDVSQKVGDEELLQQLLAPVDDAEETDPQQYLDWENPDHQALIEHLHALTRDCATLLSSMKPKERAVALAAQRGPASFTEIAERAGVSPTTVGTYLRQPGKVQTYMRLHSQRMQLSGAPAKAHRIQMAWRIAQRLEARKPEIALKALNLLAQQAGELQRDKDTRPVAPTIVLANFSSGAPAAQQEQANPDPVNEALDGVYTVVPPSEPE